MSRASAAEMSVGLRSLRLAPLRCLKGTCLGSKLWRQASPKPPIAHLVPPRPFPHLDPPPGVIRPRLNQAYDRTTGFLVILHPDPSSTVVIYPPFTVPPTLLLSLLS